jgi:DNA repair protein RadA/Sms
MVEGGMEAVASPSELFLSARDADTKNGAAAAVAVTMEGSRPILLEVQALCSSVGQQPGRRTANGVDGQRLSLLLAVSLQFIDSGIYVLPVFRCVVIFLVCP